MASEIPISVDRDFARFGSKSYAINKINSVEIRQQRPFGVAGVFLWSVAALVCLAIGGAGLLFGLLFGLLAFWSWRRSRIVEYQLFLMTSSSEAQAITSRDPQMIHDLRDRIEKAMTGQLV